MPSNGNIQHHAYSQGGVTQSQNTMMAQAAGAYQTEARSMAPNQIVSN